MANGQIVWPSESTRQAVWVLLAFQLPLMFLAKPTLGFYAPLLCFYVKYLLLYM